MKTLTVLTPLLLLVLSSAVEAQANSFEVLNPNVSQGDVVIVKAEESFFGENLGIYAFEKIWPYNKDRLAFVGVDHNTNPDSYILYHVNTETGERADWSYEEIVVRIRDFQVVRLRGNGSSLVSKKRAREKQLIQAAFDMNSSIDYIKGVFGQPLDRIEVSGTQFGTKKIYRNGYVSPHTGVDLRTKTSIRDKGLRPVMAVNSGRVVLTRKFSLEGNMVIINHGQKIFSAYMHLSKIMVKPGQVVEIGQQIAVAGATGRGTGPHLHFAMKINNAVIDPLGFIDIINKLNNEGGLQ